MHRSPLLLVAAAWLVIGPAQAAGHSVQIADDGFRPEALTIAPGDTVTWTNTGLATHSVTGNGFDSGPILPTRSWPQTFEKTGRYPYRCTFHADMTGTVVVRASSATTTTTTTTTVRRSPTTLPPDGSAVTAPGETTTTVPETTTTTEETTTTAADLDGLAAGAGDGGDAGGDDTSTGLAAALAAALLLAVSGATLLLMRRGVLA